MALKWIPQKIRDEVVDVMSYLLKRVEIPLQTLLSWVGLSRMKYYRWCAGSPKMLQIEHSAKLQLQVVNLLLFLLIRTFLAKASFLLRLAKISSCRFNKRSLGVIYPMPL